MVENVILAAPKLDRRNVIVGGQLPCCAAIAAETSAGMNGLLPEPSPGGRLEEVGEGLAVTGAPVTRLGSLKGAD